MDPDPDRKENSSPSKESTPSPRKYKAKKRKRSASDIDGSSDDDTVLPDNSILVEEKLHAAAIKNNLTEKNVKHILKKVVTNDHVLALVQLREEEESANTKNESQGPKPKLTRSKVKELMKSSRQSTAWNIELTPIDKIPVKTHPEVEALIAQDLPDESDEEYEPPLEDNHSDEEHNIDSCSDIDSLPRTPATPHSHIIESPGVVKDGPFKVPLDIKTPAKRRLLNDEVEAPMAQRTRSKLSLSATPIEHIEESFVPPDDLPVNDVDDLWSQFLSECLNPGVSFKTEDDDEADPEYNVAADPDAGKDDEELADNTLIKISKKELSDLVTELFHVMPDGTIDDSVAEKILNSSGHLPITCKNENFTENTTARQENMVNGGESSIHVFSNYTWNGKQEPACEEDDIVINSQPVTKVETLQENVAENMPVVFTILENVPCVNQETQETVSHETVVAAVPAAKSQEVPLLLQEIIEKAAQSEYVEIIVSTDSKEPLILPEQILVLQQQLRQHIQLASSSFMQLYVHPKHWNFAPTFKGFVQALFDVLKVNPNSVVNVCNLIPAQELLTTWKETLSQDTPENREMIEYLNEELKKCIRRMSQNTLYLGQFHPTFLQVIANSPVFLYPYLLPPTPYRAESTRRHSYLLSEDELIAIGLDEFWEYVENNPQLYKPPAKENLSCRWGMTHALELVSKYMFPWMPARMLSGHISHLRKHSKPDNPVLQFLYKREIIPVKHTLLPYNPSITLYEQPEHEMPLLWVRYISENSARAEKFVKRRKKITGVKPLGVEVAFGKAVAAPLKNPLPLSFSKTIIKNRYLHDKEDATVLTTNTIITTDPPVITIQMEPQNGETNESTTTPVDTPNFMNQTTPTVYNLVETADGAFLMPVNLVQDSTKTTDAVLVPVTSSNVQISDKIDDPVVVPQKVAETNPENTTSETRKPPKMKKTIPKVVLKRLNDREIRSSVRAVEHCKCCRILRSFRVHTQTKMTDFFKGASYTKSCPCTSREYPKITNKLKILLNNFKNESGANWTRLYSKAGRNMKATGATPCDREKEDPEDLAFVLKYQFKMWSTMTISKNRMLSKRVHNLLSNYYVGCNPVTLGMDMEKQLLKDEPDLFKEFLAFLTGDQADEILRFSDYFIVVHMDNFLLRLEKEIANVRDREYICMMLVEALEQKDDKACNICCEVLQCLKGYPSMAEYFFSLFPHRHKTRPPNVAKKPIPPNVAKKPIPIHRKPVKQIEVLADDAIYCECTRNEQSDDDADQEEIDVQDNKTRPPETIYLKEAPEEPTEEPVSNKLASAKVKIEPSEDSAPTDKLNIGPAVIEAEQLNCDDHEETEREVSLEKMDCEGTTEKAIINPVSNKLVLQVKTEPSDQSKPTEKLNVGPAVIEAEPLHSAGENIQDNNNMDTTDGEDTPDSTDSLQQNGEVNTDDITVCKTEVQGHDTRHLPCTASAPRISVEKGAIKLEPLEWSREEDKLILNTLNTLKENLIQDDSPCSIEVKTIELIADSLPNKSLVDVKQRIMYILHVLTLIQDGK